MSATPEVFTATTEHAGRNCPYCRFPFKVGAEALTCGSCKAMHHAECWEDNRGCAVMGCPSGPSASPATPPPPRPAAAPPPPPPAAPAPAGPAVAPAPRIPVSTPSAAEFATQVRSWLTTPVAVAIGTSALIALGLLIVVGFLVAALTPHDYLVGSYFQLFPGDQVGLFKETMRDAVGTTQARFGVLPTHAPVLALTFAVVPVFAVAVGVHRRLAALTDLSARGRVIAGAATAVPFTIGLMILAALARGGGDPFTGPFGFSQKSVLLYGLLWGVLGGLLGAEWRNRAAVTLPVLPAAVGRWVRLLGAAARPLGVLLIVCALLGATVWEIEMARESYGDSKAEALIESPLNAGQYAIDTAALGTLAKYRMAEDTPTPLPADKGRYVHATAGGTYRVFDYRRAYPLFAFVFGIILLLGSVLACAAYAGFAVAGLSGARSRWAAAAYGALVGPVWAVALVLLRAIADRQLMDGGSLFTSALLVGAIAGAMGGLLASLRTAAATGPVTAPGVTAP